MPEACNKSMHDSCPPRVPLRDSGRGRVVGHMPVVGFGTAHMSEEHILQALKMGVRHLDCARLYGNEHLVGNALREFCSQSTSSSIIGERHDPSILTTKEREKGSAIEDRSSFFITSKIWCEDHRPERVRMSVEATLRDLGVEYLDLLLIHWPRAFIPGKPLVEDVGTPLAVTWEAMEELVKEQKIRALGVSNFDRGQLESLLSSSCRVCKPVVNQIELHPGFQQEEYVTFLQNELDILPVAWGPLNFGKGTIGNDPTLQKLAKKDARVGGSLKVVTTAPSVAGKQEALMTTAHSVALCWNLQRGVAVIPSSTNAKHVGANLACATAWCDQRDARTKHEDERQDAKSACALPLSASQMAEIAVRCETGRRRFPDIIGIWPETAGILSRGSGLALDGWLRWLIYPLISPFVGPLYLPDLRRRLLVERRRASSGSSRDSCEGDSCKEK
ncbi:unnamed protein product [Amoebophrya sp. A25]|nr:unnamed protein product [Amoebophrya sp. A25]|eukprot:GSA25T00006573001.1